MQRQRDVLTVGVVLACLLFVVSACANLKSSRTILPMKEYERMLVGSLEAEFIGNEKCLKACHEHDTLATYLAQSAHGRTKESRTGMPLVNCETCHGPGSLAVAKAGETKKCDVTAFVQLSKLPATAQSILCLKCHSTHAMYSMQFWPSSAHAMGDVSCSDCHRLHAGPGQVLTGPDEVELCYGCHPEVRISFSLFSRHPLGKDTMTCSTCHDPHGTVGGGKIRGADLKDLCLGCHASKVAPYTYEHGDMADDCSACHAPHGSAFASLLILQEPFLCFQCHDGGHTPHAAPLAASTAYKRAYYSRCTHCHSQIHGTDTPGRANTSQFLE